MAIRDWREASLFSRPILHGELGLPTVDSGNTLNL